MTELKLGTEKEKIQRPSALLLDAGKIKTDGGEVLFIGTIICLI
jgi:hypothetical protein